ncbi:hypothetical protein F4824DRAFT_186670 [Ustulina deusta]|nr:hypothetical protein F4823DRAFT_630816 [Ustulina deusta]KAI3334451.1 hypothetical protein F4824DRAFT_186670 [Ustulina deusta]
MVKIHLVPVAIIAPQCVIAMIGDRLSLFPDRIKRQDPGSAAYSCHEACGGAIVQARSSENVCSNDVFLDDYKTCLECAGADNTDIWKYYSGTLSGIAESCGLPTTPEGNESSGAESTTSTGPTSTAVESKSSSSSIGITAAPTQSTTPTESSTTSETSSPAANGTATVSYADICIQHSLL